MVKGVEGRPAKTVISAISPKIAKNWGNRRIIMLKLLNIQEVKGQKGTLQNLRFLKEKSIIIRYLIYYCVTYKMMICCQNSFVKTS